MNDNTNLLQRFPRWLPSVFTTYSCLVKTSL